MKTTTRLRAIGALTLMVTAGLPLAPAAAANLNVLKLKLTNTSPAAPSGRITAKGDFFTLPPTDTFDASSPIAFEFRDTLNLNETQTFQPADCVTTPGKKIRCLTADRFAAVKFTVLASSPGVFKFALKLRKRNIHAPFVEPVSVTLSHGTVPTLREDTLTECKHSPQGLKCNRL